MATAQRGVVIWKRTPAGQAELKGNSGARLSASAQNLLMILDGVKTEEMLLRNLVGVTTRRLSEPRSTRAHRARRCDRCFVEHRGRNKTSNVDQRSGGSRPRQAICGCSGECHQDASRARGLSTSQCVRERRHDRRVARGGSHGHRIDSTAQGSRGGRRRSPAIGAIGYELRPVTASRSSPSTTLSADGRCAQRSSWSGLPRMTASYSWH